MNKLQNIYSIALEQNVDLMSIKVAFAVGVVYFTTAPSFIVKTESCY